MIRDKVREYQWVDGSTHYSDYIPYQINADIEEALIDGYNWRVKIFDKHEGLARDGETMRETVYVVFEYDDCPELRAQMLDSNRRRHGLYAFGKRGED